LSKLVSLNQEIPQYDDSHYAVVDLGSNSFHLLITRLIITSSGSYLEPVNKVKQKVRLAAGLDSNNLLSDEAIHRGINCLRTFSLHLSTIPLNNITIVATAALRIAKNNEVFFKLANDILPKNIKLLSGVEEAKTIFAGVAHTAFENNQHEQVKKLVIDIGGASTEIIVGEGSNAKNLVSLDIGCVSFICKFFSDGLLTQESFNLCINAAENVIDTVKDDFIKLGWQSVVGSSGTMQAMVEILKQRQMPAVITLDFLNEIQQSLINCQHINTINIEGLREDRKAVLASGLCILIALFNCLTIKSLCLSSGALREGLLFELAPDAKIV
jgi:exopolyphosphatase/guanosine-5'-triphosphate,3'-diphosphate pyrophosphatase